MVAQPGLRWQVDLVRKVVKASEDSHVLSARKANAFLAASLALAVFLWGGNNTGTKFIVTAWPPVWTGAWRFCCAGLLIVAGVVLGQANWQQLISPRAVPPD